ncbi:MAG: pyridoxal phosphate-dependent aminotransferase [Deltaproteobacteria bacterium]|nr:pyridoxal phosphate-dependent aminotransferase [Deltaproteobacteria bacterium]
MFQRVRYIEWALKFYGKVPLDLASSGIPHAAWSELGVPEPALDDPEAYGRFTAAIARYNDVSPAEVMPALGTSHAVFLAYASMLSPGDEVVVETPGYEPLVRTAEGLGATARTFERRGSEGFRVVPERVAAAVTAKTRAIVVTNHHNPTGVTLDDATIVELATIAEARGAHLLVDEVYAPFEALPENGVFARSARKLASNVVAVGSLTKCYGLGMHRVGWVLGPPEIIERAHVATIATAGHLPLAHAARGAVALANVGKLATRAKALYAGKREIAAAWAKTLPRASWSAPTSGLFGLVTIDGAGDLLPRIESWATEHGVLVGAGGFFGVPNGFRLSWATLEKEKLEAGLSKLSDLLA